MISQQEALRNHQRVEQSFFDSLRHLATCYGFRMPPVSEEVYPYNIRLAYQYAREQLKERSPNVEVFIMQDSTRAACLTTAGFFSVGQLLYYIPVAPLHRLLLTRDKRGPLVLSVFAYLSQTVQVSSFQEPDSFLHSCYSTITEWFTEQAGEWERQDWEQQRAELRSEEQCGKRLLKRINSRCHLQQFKKRLQHFKALSEADKRIQTIAEGFFTLMNQYPGRSIHQSVCYDLLEPHADERMWPEHYLSLVWKNAGWMADQLLEYVNSALCEYSVADEPVAFQWFDQPQQGEHHDLHFAKTLFTLIDELIEYLNKLS